MGGGSNLAMSSLSLPPGHDVDDGDDDDDDDDAYHNGGHCGVTFVVQITLRVSMKKLIGHTNK